MGSRDGLGFVEIKYYRILSERPSEAISRFNLYALLAVGSQQYPTDSVLSGPVFVHYSSPPICCFFFKCLALSAQRPNTNEELNR